LKKKIENEQHDPTANLDPGCRFRIRKNITGKMRAKSWLEEFAKRTGDFMPEGFTRVPYASK
jgi:hypothetical protein